MTSSHHPDNTSLWEYLGLGDIPLLNLDDSMGTEPSQKQLDQMTADQLREELGKAREILMGIGAEFYTLALLKDGNLAPMMPIPMDWARQAHQLMEGYTLSGEVLAQIQVEDPEKVYTGFFTDSYGHTWYFFYDRSSFAARLHTTSPILDPALMPPEVKTWYTSLREACQLIRPLPSVEEVNFLKMDPEPTSITPSETP